MSKTIHIIAGPTAGGKSALALRRTIDTGGEIINIDSRQIYNELPILSAQPPEEDLRAAPHHLYGVMDPNDNCSAGVWLGMAMPLINDLLSKGVTPIVTGGNGMYIKALLEGMSPIPDIPPEIRDAANARQQELGNPAFYEELKKRDPETAALYHPMHTARLVHAWEILEATGKPFAYWQSLPREAPPDDWMFDITIVMPPREKLYANCNARFHQMIAMGAVEELEAFDRKVEEGLISKDAILIKTVGAQALRDWRKGMIAKEEAIDLAQTETRHYAKRQTTWFNNQIRPQKNIANITVKN